MKKLITAAISKIHVDNNLRADDWKEKVAELKPSIKAVGLQQPILVIPLAKKGPQGETYELIYGSRRLEACRQLKHTTIQALLGSKMTHKEKLLAKIAENDNRKDLSPLEQADAYNQIMSECKLTARKLAEEIGKTDGFVSQRLALLKLEPSVKTAIQKETITPTHARELARIKDPKQQKQLLQKAVKTQATDFKETVDAVIARTQDKTLPRKGRPEKEKPAPTPASSKTPPEKESSPYRSISEIDNSVNRMNMQIKAAVKAENELHKAHLKGVVRGITWAAGIKGAQLPNLYE